MNRQYCHALVYGDDGSFYGKLAALVKKADSTNLKQLEIAFPEHVALYREWRESEDDFIEAHIRNIPGNE